MKKQCAKFYLNILTNGQGMPTVGGEQMSRTQFATFIQYFKNDYFTTVGQAGLPT